MDVRVKERRQQPAAALTVYELFAVVAKKRPRLAQLGNPPPTHAHVVASVDARARIEHVHVAQQQLCRRARLVEQDLHTHHTGRVPGGTGPPSGHPARRVASV